jgi:hypothetical protein
MFEHRDPTGSRFKTYEVRSESFGLQEGARIGPGSSVGKDIRSGQAIEVDFRGYVATAYFNPMHQRFLVMICRLSESREAEVPGIRRYQSVAG